MTDGTVLPFSGMSAGENRKKPGVVLFKLTFLAGRMAGKTSVAFISISCDSLVFFIHFRLLVFMAGQTGKVSKRRRVLMANHAVAPSAIMFA